MSTRALIQERMFLSDIGVWPGAPKTVDPKGWLKNFDAEDAPIAEELLDSFTLISNEHATHMVMSAFRSLSKRFVPLRGDNLVDAWRRFQESVLVSYPIGRKADTVSSGVRYARALQDQTAVKKEHVLGHRELLAAIASSERSPVSIVLVDDFAGSGHQIHKTWLQSEKLDDGRTHSLQSLHDGGFIGSIDFVPAVATAISRKYVRDMRMPININPATLLPPAYSASHPETILVSPASREKLRAFLEKYAEKAGYEKTAAFGYEKMGLALSFEDSTPDSTLQLFNGGPNRPASWRPLRREHS